MTICQNENPIIADQFLTEDGETLKKKEKILCNHCLRTASNGIRCMGICVADNDY